MIVAEGWTVYSCAGDSSLGVRITGTKFCDGGFSMRDLEDAVQNEARAHSEGAELAEGASVNETPGVIPHWEMCIALEQVECSS